MIDHAACEPGGEHVRLEVGHRQLQRVGTRVAATGAIVVRDMPNTRAEAQENISTMISWCANRMQYAMVQEPFAKKTDLK